MAGETVITVVGNLTADPELRYTQNGLPVANFTIASTPRSMKDGEWKDGDPLFLRASCWREFAEHVAGSLTKGMRVMAQGRLRQRSYQDREGNQRTAIELEVDEIGPSLRYATAQVTRAARTDGQQRPAASAPVEEQWATSEPPAEGDGPMAMTPRSELVDKVTNALMDEAYDGSMGPMGETEFPRHVRRLAETVLEAITGAEDATPADPPRPMCPECRDGKHAICIHQALSDDDEFVDCACGCEPSRTCPSCRDVVPIGWTLDDHFNCNFPEDRDA